MAVYSKIIRHSCYELGHTWNTSCTIASLELMLSAFFGGMKIYGMVYLISTIASRHKLSKKYIIRLVQNYFQSVSLLAVNAGAYVASFCILRFLLRHINYLSASFLPAFLASFIAILIERPARRNVLSIYVMNIASECLWNALVYRDLVRPVPYGGVIVFSLCMTFYGYYFKSNKKFSPFFQPILQMLLSTHEVEQCQRNLSQNLPSGSTSTVNIKHEGINKQKLCPHSKSCFQTLVQTFLRSFSQGYLLQSGLAIVSSVPKIFLNPSLLWQKMTRRSNLKMGLFLSWFATTFQFVCCLMRRIRGKDDPIHGTVAGATAGLGLIFSPSNTITLYAFWKAVEALYEKGLEKKCLPSIPFGIEILYSLSTAFLFHIAVFENFNMRASYWRFLFNLTNGRIGDYNRLVLEPFKMNSGKFQKWPQYDHSYLSEAFKKEFAHRLKS